MVVEHTSDPCPATHLSARATQNVLHPVGSITGGNASRLMGSTTFTTRSDSTTQGVQQIVKRSSNERAGATECCIDTGHLAHRWEVGRPC